MLSETVVRFGDLFVRFSASGFDLSVGPSTSSERRGVTICGHDLRSRSLYLNYVKTSGFMRVWQSVAAQAVEESIRFLLGVTRIIRGLLSLTMGLRWCSAPPSEFRKTAVGGQICSPDT